MLPFLSSLLAAACMTSPSHAASSLSPYGGGAAIGSGPVWVVAPLEHGGVHFERRSDGTYAANLLWIVAPRWRFLTVIDVVGGRFVGGTQEIQGVGQARWRDRPSTVVSRAGCLRFQIGGPGFARRITVRVVT
jgi:hypothetical protein